MNLNCISRKYQILYKYGLLEMLRNRTIGKNFSDFSSNSRSCLNNYFQTGASMYQTMALALNCFKELYEVMSFGFLRVAITLDENIPAHCRPSGGSVLIHVTDFFYCLTTIFSCSTYYSVVFFLLLLDVLHSAVHGSIPGKRKTSTSKKPSSDRTNSTGRTFAFRSARSISCLTGHR